MDQMLDVTYYYHSGFSCAMDDVLLVFDYWLGEQSWPPMEARMTTQYLSRFREVYVFISHSHPDHFDPVVYEWSGAVPVVYVISDDMPGYAMGTRVKSGDTLTLSDNVTVHVYDSTDLGVSFLVDVCGVRVFHAGDLNFWHWREESTVQEIEEAEDAFTAAVAPIAGESVDLAMFPVDPRQGSLFDAGVNYFIMTVKPRLLVPMHFFGRADSAVEFARRSRSAQTEIIALTRPGEKMRMQLAPNGSITVNLLAAPEPAPQRVEPVLDLEGDGGSDPFLDTDLPVRLEDGE